MVELRRHVELAQSEPKHGSIGRTRRLGRVTAPRRARRPQAADDVGWSKPIAWRVLGLFFILAIFLGPRLHDLDRLVTPDEPIWLARSANFYEALSGGDLKSTYQFAHPGVTVMWFGAMGYVWAARDYPDQVSGQISQRQNRIAGVLISQGHDPLTVLVASRIALILGMALMLGAAYLLALRLLGYWEVSLGFLLIALEPFGVGITRLLHVDGIASISMLLAVVAALVYVFRGRRNFDLVFAGVAFGLSVLTRSQLGFLAPWFVLLVVLDTMAWRASRNTVWPAIRASARPILAWSAVTLATMIVLWPALWADPVTVVRDMLDFASTAALEGHERAIFFAGFVYEGDPGVRFYPATFLWRASPATVAALFAAVLALVFARRWSLPATQVRIILSLLLAAGMYGLMMSMAAKKFDRYLLPIYPLIALVGAWGLLTVARRIGRRTDLPVWVPAATAGVLALAISLSGIRATEPYFLSYYSPVLGGAKQAPESMMVGWGEGLDQVADFLNALPESDRIVASTESWRTPLSYFFDGDARFASYVDDPPGVFRWVNSDYYILYITPLSRNGVWQPFLEYLGDREPVLRVTLNELEYARVYEIRDEPLPEYMEQGGAGMVQWAGIGRFVAGGKSENSGTVRGSVVKEILYFDRIDPQATPVLAEQYGLRLSLVDSSGTVVSSTDGPLELNDPIRHGLHWLEREIEIPIDILSGTYAVEMQVYDLATGMMVPGFSFRTGERIGPGFQVDSVFVVSSQVDLDDLPELLP
ncbi:hypothetical protein BH23CHL5_BH23CHL5_17790 [soil metagenome]